MAQVAIGEKPPDVVLQEKRISIVQDHATPARHSRKKHLVQCGHAVRAVLSLSILQELQQGIAAGLAADRLGDAESHLRTGAERSPLRHERQQIADQRSVAIFVKGRNL